MKQADVLIIGGGINGCGIAADAAERGLNVILCEKDDLAHHTSSCSTKLIHGGLRYLEQCEFKLVRESLHEREILLNKAPHLVHPLRFILPHQKNTKPVWLIRLGLYLYDHLYSRQKMQASQKIKLKNTIEGLPLKSNGIAFEYSDCYTDDSRLVIANAKAAENNGAQILTRTSCQRIYQKDQLWLGEFFDKNTNETILIKAKSVINATGPWAESFLVSQCNMPSPYKMKLVKGSHFIVKRFYEGDHAYILLNDDGRVIFTIPYRDDFCLIGTTDVSFSGEADDVFMDHDEEHYLINVVNRYFKHVIRSMDIVWRYSGVRPLYDDASNHPSEITRDFRIDVKEVKGLPLISVFGGKLTTFRLLAEAVINPLHPYFPKLIKSKTENTFLPGGDFSGKSFSEFLAMKERFYSFLNKKMIKRMVMAYGSEIDIILKGVVSIEDLGQHFVADFYQKEVDYLIQHEWVKSVDDLIWRRTKMGLYLTHAQLNELENHLITIAPKNRSFCE